ncbi:glutaredoxin [Lentinula raphanica]|uniref:Glutaredoxin n=1 Tax=Lentinula raphanica TaxID=153919 RepID=A0AA38P0J7_9AGAR|nr:glutaredoxin [Lentinula raphanica]KAJ3834054.1 glutaredoxin [Lentinula raphanica]KAJ3965063.1 glutaredoxin [Lentinula raphanica]
MSSNSHEVNSPSHFQQLLSADLNRVSVLNFWAPWAEPCKQMNEVTRELAKKFPSILFLQIEAEGQADIAESFDIEAVPSLLILRGHTLLQRISGADAPALTAAVAKFAAPAPSINPQSTTNVLPAKASDSIVVEKEEDIESRMTRLMNQSKVVLFMKGSPDAPRCGFSRRICGLLRDQKVDFAHFDILTDESVRQGLKKRNDWPTFPQLIINGEFVGGLDIVQEMVENGEFADALSA